MTCPGHRVSHQIRFSNSPSRSRGAFSPGSCFALAHRDSKGRREDRAPAGAHEPLCKLRDLVAHRGDDRCSRDARPSLRSGWNGLCRALAGERCTIAPVALRLLGCELPGRAKRIAARLDAQTPGVTITRFCRTRPCFAPWASQGIWRRLSYPRPLIAHGVDPALRPPLAPTPPASTAPHPANRDDRDPPLPTG